MGPECADWHRNSFGDGANDPTDYFLVVRDVTLTEQACWLLT